MRVIAEGLSRKIRKLLIPQPDRVLATHKLFRGGLRNDDETLLVLQREEESLLFMLGEVASSNTLGRLLRSHAGLNKFQAASFRFQKAGPLLIAERRQIRL